MLKYTGDGLSQVVYIIFLGFRDFLINGIANIGIKVVESICHFFVICY